MTARKMFKTSIALTIMLALVIVQSVWADDIQADADALVLNSPHSNAVTTTQNGGTTLSYDFSAYIKETGNATNDVFKNPGDEVSVTITKSGDWLSGGTSAPGPLIPTIPLKLVRFR